MNISDISVVIPSYNSGHTIRECLDSVLACTGGNPCEIIVVDSGSDNTSDIVSGNYSEVKYIHSATRLFPGAARNIGWRQATGQVVAFLDSDCIVSADWLMQIAKAHKQSCAVITGSFEMANPDDIWGFIVFCAELSGSLPGQKPGPSRLTPSGNTSYKRNALELTGGYKEDIFCEDTILANDLLERGEHILFCPKIKVFHINREGYQSFKAAFNRSGYYSGIARKMFRLPGHIFAKNPWLIPLLVPYRILNVYRVNSRGKNRFQKRLLLNFPLVVWAMLLWAGGFVRGVKSVK